MTKEMQGRMEAGVTPVFTPSRGGLLQRKCACGSPPGLTGDCEECGQKRMTLQRHAAGQTEPSTVPPIVHDVLRSSGQPLDSATRAFFEPRFGHDFGQVRVHTSARAAESAFAVNARAYTVGRDVVFASGQYQPQSGAGRRLLAHELTHVLQQRSSGDQVSGNLRMSAPGETGEQEADRVAEMAVLGEASPSARLALHPERSVLQRACWSGADCPRTAAGVLSVPGSASDFNTRQEAQERGPRARRDRMFLRNPASAVASGHAGHARQLERFFISEVGALPAAVTGYFIDMDMASGTGSMVMRCADFTPPIPAAAGQFCVLVPPDMNQQALQFNQGAALVGGVPRQRWRLETIQAMIHEIQHQTFDTAAVAAPAAAGACTRARVQEDLTELNAIMSEFPIIYNSVPRGPGANPAVVAAQTAELGNWWLHKITNPSESIAGTLRAMRCICECTEVEAWVRQVFNFTTTTPRPWRPDERAAFLAEVNHPRWAAWRLTDRLAWPSP